jgi:O-antigen/teichoic acid export membrane protein
MPKLKTKIRTLTQQLHIVFYTAKNSSGLRQTAYSTAGSLMASGLAALATILITRRLGPEQFGYFSTAFALVLILIRFNDAGLSTVTSRFVAGANKARQQAKYWLGVTKLRLILSALLLIAMLALSPIISRLLTISQALTISAIILTFATVYFEHLQYSLQALHLFKRAAAANVLQAVFKLAFALCFFIFGTKTITSAHSIIEPSSIMQGGMVQDGVAVLPIFIAYMSAPGIPALFTWHFLPTELRHKIKQLIQQSAKLKPELGQMQQLMSHSALSIISAGIIENIDVLFVKAYLSDFEAGLLGGVSRVAMLIYILAYSVGNVLNARVAKYKSKQHLAKYWRKAWLVLALSLVGLGLSLALARPVLLLTIGRQYLPGLNIMKIMLASGFVSLGVMPFIAFFYSFDLPWYFSVTGLVQLAIVLLGNGWLVPVYGLAAAAWTRLAARAVLLVMSLVLAGWYYRREYG